MKTKHPVYHALLGLMEIFLPGFSRPLLKQVTAFLCGAFAAQSIVLRKVAAAQVALSSEPILPKSREKAILRLLSCARLNWRHGYRPLLQNLLQPRPEERLFVLLDETARTDKFRVLVAALWYQGRALPIAWVSWRANRKIKGQYWRQVDRLLALLSLALPAKNPVVIVADRAFGHPQFIDRVVKHGWNWLVRIQKRTCFCDVQGRCCQVWEKVPQPQTRFKAQGKLFKRAGWRQASVVGYWSGVHRQALIVASDLPGEWVLLDWYKKRGAIECLFRDWKAGGWHWEECQVQDFHHHERLLLLMSLATLFAVCLGEQKATEILSRPITARRSRCDEAKDSLFHLGLQQAQSCFWQIADLQKNWRFTNFHLPSWSRQLANAHGRAYVFAPR